MKRPMLDLRWLFPRTAAHSLLDPICECWPFDEFEHQRTDALSFFEPVDVPDVGVVQRGEDFGFTFKPGEAIRILCERLGEHFEGYVSVELGVSRPIHLAHAAFADLGGDLVWAEGGAG